MGSLFQAGVIAQSAVASMGSMGRNGRKKPFSAGVVGAGCGRRIAAGRLRGEARLVCGIRAGGREPGRWCFAASVAARDEHAVVCSATRCHSWVCCVWRNCAGLDQRQMAGMRCFGKGGPNR